MIGGVFKAKKQTNLLKSASTQTVETVEEREDIKQLEDVDPLKSFHLWKSHRFISNNSGNVCIRVTSCQLTCSSLLLVSVCNI